jgi:hypothetical protein
MKRLILPLILSLVCSSAYSEISKTTFDSTLEGIGTLYGTHITGIWNPRSIIARSSARMVDNEIRVQIDGEFAQNPETSKEAFVLVVCHEFGHILRDRPGLSRLQKEGQADHYAPLCAFKYLGAIAEFRTDSLPVFLKEACSEKFSGSNYETCLLVASGIHSFAKVLKVDIRLLYNSEQDYVASSSLHPAPSCRVKTLIAGLFDRPLPVCNLRTR